MVYSLKSKCLCISTQIGCKTGCVFCASGSRGFIRNLTVEEMKEEFCHCINQGFPIEILHLGGVGEPLRNLENVMSLKDSIDVDYIQITTSVPDEKSLRTVLNSDFDSIIISMHSMIDATRKDIIPNSLPVTNIIDLLDEETEKNPKLKDIVRISYLLLGDKNTSFEEETKFFEFVKQSGFRLLLMAYNVVNGNEKLATDISKYIELKKRIVIENINCEDCVLSLSRRDNIGGCGTLFSSKIK